jgi:hypothetical protein
MTEAAAAELPLPQGQEEMPPALQRLWKRRGTMTAPLPEDINLGVLEDLLLQSAQVGERRDGTVQFGSSATMFAKNMQAGIGLYFL